MAALPSLCLYTVVMNRLHHLRQTLPVNLEHNTRRTTSFVVLDYASGDGLQQYILDHFGYELRTGKLRYHRYAYAKYFSHAHSRNLAVRLAKADYVCNVDADNFTGENFDSFLAATFARHPRAVISALGNRHRLYGAFGRMAVARNALLAVGGYDETFDGYGFEDYDVVSRLEQHGLEKITISDPAYLQAIPHGNADRVAAEWTSDQFLQLYRQQVSDRLQVLLYLFKDQRFHYGVVQEDFEAGMHYRYTLAGDAWQAGSWNADGDGVQLQFADFAVRFERIGNCLFGHHHYMQMETGAEALQEAILFHTNMRNSCRYRYNLHHQIIRVNEKGFGRGTTQPLIFHHSTHR